MAALRLVARSFLRANTPHFPFTSATTSRAAASALINQIHKRDGSYVASEKYDKDAKYADYEVTKDQKEWEFVMRALGSGVVPQPPTEEKVYPSGWKPQSKKALELPYFVERTPNHMLPVYVTPTYRGMRRITKIKGIQGDIWLLEKQLKEHIQNFTDIPIGSQINESVGTIQFRGDYVILVRGWLLEQGF